MSNKIEEQIENLDKKMDVRLGSIDKTLIVNTESLNLHIKRTDMLEDYVKKELSPIKKHVETMSLGFKGIAWFCGIIVSVCGFVYLLKQLNVF